MKTAVTRNRTVFLNSCIVGSNAYYSLDNMFFLEKDIEEHRKQVAHHVIEICSSSQDKLFWLVKADGEESKSNQFRSLIEKRQWELMGQDHIVWPMDIINSGGINGWIIDPIDEERFSPIQHWLYEPSEYNPSLAVQLFGLVKRLHDSGISLNGFYREQLRVDRQNKTLWLWPGGTTSSLNNDCRSSSVYTHHGFLSFPDAEQSFLTELNDPERVSRIRDIYSAAILSFYLLFHIHPFVGKNFWPLLNSEYLAKYNENPIFIFNDEDDNSLGMQTFEKAIKSNWSDTLPELKEL